MVRAKFVVNQVIRRQLWNGNRMEEGFTIELNPVTSGSAENEKFYGSTPSGSVSMSVWSAETAASFKIGEAYYVDFTPASK